ncbi:MAG: hypothetical protein OXE86_04955 [Alphaproteobacteria bacterium]|nr:hypothetical protein [Alphaproteobacteria bacterium]
MVTIGTWQPESGKGDPDGGENAVGNALNDRGHKVTFLDGAALRAAWKCCKWQNARDRLSAGQKKEPTKRDFWLA